MDHADHPDRLIPDLKQIPLSGTAPRKTFSLKRFT